MSLAKLRPRPALGVLLGAALSLLLVTNPATAQPGPPDIDHYLLYRTFPPLTLGRTVILVDQFSTLPYTHFVRELDFFAIPVSKDSSFVFDPRLHYTWWTINPIPFGARVTVSNQFGDQELFVREPHWLVNPALKFPQPPFQLPQANHYKCYDADGRPPIPGRVVALEDQFGHWSAVVDSAKIYCNPTYKTADGVTYPVLRPDAHLVCYRIELLPPQPLDIGVSFVDQFMFNQVRLVQQVYLCVPTLKHDVVPTEAATWGRIKATYR